jgi:hypothetical protein
MGYTNMMIEMEKKKLIEEFIEDLKTIVKEDGYDRYTTQRLRHKWESRKP